MNHFFAYINRMRFIQRWALLRNSYSENIQEHSHREMCIRDRIYIAQKRCY